jgi:nicotinate-nucleotide adenylyltransferase
MLGIFGGTFDPVHIGHLRVALDALELLGLHELRFVPLAQAVHREQPLAGPHDRLAMLQAAIAGQPGFHIDDREVEQGGPSYTVDTLASLRREHGPNTPLCLLVGADAFAGLVSWRAPAEIVALAHLIVLQRPGHELQWDAALMQQLGAQRVESATRLRTTPAGMVMPLQVSALDISSSDIRRRMNAGRSIRYLVPDPVLEIITRQGLYTTR